MRDRKRAIYALIALGLGFLAGAFFSYKGNSDFVNGSVRTSGEVVALVKSGSRNSTAYRPEVVFRTAQGEVIDFISATGSSPPAYSKGEKVEVLYRVDDPHRAKIAGFFSLWGSTSILAFFGGFLFLFGTAVLLLPLLQGGWGAYMRKRGRPLETEFQGMETNESLSVLGRHPLRVLSSWRDPLTSERRVFRSGLLWSRPDEGIKERPIIVFIDEKRANRYFMDLSSLPKAED